MTIRLREFAKNHGVCYQTAWRWFKKGKIPNAEFTPTGKVIVREPDEKPVPTKTVVYCRVSSSQNKDNLETQAERVSAFCNAKGWVIGDIIKEVGSGLNDTRKGLMKVLSDPTVARIVVEHKDRLTRFGFNYIQALFQGEIVVINEAKEDRDDLMGDFVAIVTSFCARLYGLRQNRRRTEQIIEELSKQGSDA